MARRPTRASRSHDSEEAGSGGALPPADLTPRQQIVEAFMALLAERRFEEIGLGEIAARAGLSLAELRNEFASSLGILAAHAKELDRRVLAGNDSDMSEEPPRERLFDVLMRRLELMVPHREAIASLMRSARRNAPLALALNGLTVRSQVWMLTAADISASGPLGMVRAQGLALLFARVLETFIDDDDDPSLARTMSALDRELARGQRFGSLLDGITRFSPTRCFGRRRRRGRERESYGREGDETVAA
jgi:AcrR family transcriptional regulator